MVRADGRKDNQQLLVKGETVGEFYEDQNIFEVAVWSVPEVHSDLSALQSLMFDTPTGGLVPLKEVADIMINPTPNQIVRESASRYTEVTCNVRDRDLGSVAENIEMKLAGMSFDLGYHAELLGEYLEQQQSERKILSLSILALVGIFVILFSVPCGTLPS